MVTSPKILEFGVATKKPQSVIPAGQFETKLASSIEAAGMRGGVLPTYTYFQLITYYRPISLYKTLHYFYKV